MARSWKKQRRQPWKISRSRLSDAADLLGLTKPVRVLALRDKDCPPGKYYRGLYQAGARRHTIRILPSLSMEKANEVLWHELGHAYQSERPFERVREPVFLDKEGTFRHDAQEFAKYYNSRSEREARGIAYEFAPLYMLCYEVK